MSGKTKHVIVGTFPSHVEAESFILRIRLRECREPLLSKGDNLLLGKRSNFDIGKAPEFKRFCSCSAGGNKQVVLIVL